MRTLNRLFNILIVLCLALMLAVPVYAIAISEDRNTPTRSGEQVGLSVAVANRIYQGGMVGVDTSNYAVQATLGTTVRVVGVADGPANNTSGAAGALTVIVNRGVHRLANSSGADAISDNDIGTTVYAADNLTLALTDGSGTRPPACRVVDVETAGVWCDFSTQALPPGSGYAVGDLGTGSVNTTHIVNGTLITEDFANSAITTALINSDAVTNPKVADGAISLEHLDSGIAPGYVLVVCNTTTAENDADASVTETHASIAATDIVTASMANSTAGAYINSTTPASGSVVFGLSGNGGVDTRINYCAARAAL